jgi:hypothetical protein
MIYKSNFSDAINRIKEKVNINPKELDKVLKVAATSVQGTMMRRVFNDGKDSKNGMIGSYSTRPTLVGRSSFVNKSAWDRVFKTKKYKWVTFRGRKLKVLTGGYKQIRQIEGKETVSVNLTRTGKLSKSLVIEPTANGYIIGFLPYGAKLSQYQEDHWNKMIFAPSSNEKRIITTIVNNYLNSKING